MKINFIENEILIYIKCKKGEMMIRFYFYLFCFLFIETNLYSENDLITIIPGHNMHIPNIIFSSDGDLIATSGDNDILYDGSIKIWESENGKFLGTIGIFPTDDPVYFLSFLGNNKLVMQNNDSLFIIQFNIDSITEELKYNYIRGIKNYTSDPPGSCFMVSKNEKFIASAYGQITGYDDVIYTYGQIRLFDQDLALLKSFDIPASTIDISPDENFIAYSFYFAKDTINILDIETGNIIKTYVDKIGRINSIKYSPDGLFLYILSDSSDFRIIDLTLDKIIKINTGSASPIRKLELMKNDKNFITINIDGELNIWDFPGNTIFKSTTIPEIRNFSTSPDCLLLAADVDGYLKIFTLDDFKEKWGNTGFNGYISSLNFSKDNKFLAATSYGRGLKIYSTDNYKLIQSYYLDKYLFTAKYSPNGKYLAVSGSATLKLLNLTTGTDEELTDYIDTTYGIGRIEAICFSPDSKILAFSPESGPIYFWNIENHSLDSGLIYEYGTVAEYSMCFSHDGKLFVYGNWNDKINIFNFDTKKLFKILDPLDKNPGSYPYVQSVDFSYDYKLLISQHNYKAYLWDVNNGIIINSVQKWANRNISFIPSMKKLYGINDKGRITFWDLDFKELKKFEDYPVIQQTLIYSHDLKYVASGGRDGSILIWKGPDTTFSNIEFNEKINDYLIYPNPVSSTIKINYNVPHFSFVKISVYDIFGSEIKTIVNEFQNEGNKSIESNIDSNPDGIYFIRLQAGTEQITEKFIKLK